MRTFPDGCSYSEIMKTSTTIALTILLCAAVYAQTPSEKPEFEVATVRPSPQTRPDRVGVGLRMDGSQAYISYFPLQAYIAMAYRVQQYQVSGPDWINSTMYNVNAKLPEGTTPRQIPEMLQSLLAERFQLKLHHEQKELPVYALILGKAPLALKEVEPAAERKSNDPISVAAEGSGAGVAVDLGNGSWYTFGNNKFESHKVTLDQLATMLERYVDRPILNMTNLKGTYDVTLNVTPEDYRAMLVQAAVKSGVTLPPEALRLMDGNPVASLSDAFEAVGLKMVARKAPLDLLVVDQVSKTPTLD
jgi:uncharacterized protein (TIGR03435 family)